MKMIVTNPWLYCYSAEHLFHQLYMCLYSYLNPLLPSLYHPHPPSYLPYLMAYTIIVEDNWRL